jgi:hypothetical protein
MEGSLDTMSLFASPQEGQGNAHLHSFESCGSDVERWRNAPDPQGPSEQRAAQRSAREAGPPKK